MAGLYYEVTVADRVHPWPVVFEIAEHTDIDNWTLVGGLMVHVHAIRAGVDARPTGDVDVILSAATAKVSAIAAPLQTLGFTPKLPELGGPLHRFTRGDDIVDIMVPSGVTARWSQRPILRRPEPAKHSNDETPTPSSAPPAKCASLCPTSSDSESSQHSTKPPTSDPIQEGQAELNDRQRPLLWS